MAKSAGLTNEDLNQLLADLGFERDVLIAGKFKRVWKHLDAGTIIVLPDNRTQESPLRVDLIAVRNQLHFNGHMAFEEFDEFVRRMGQTVSQ